MTLTYSGQIEQYAADTSADLYLIASHRHAQQITSGRTTLEHLPKPLAAAQGILFHFRELLYGLMLLQRALAWQADVAVIDSGTTHYFLLSIFRLMGIPVIPVLHNTLWPAGHTPRSLARRTILKLDSLFWRRVPLAVLVISPECRRQLEEVGATAPIVQYLPQFNPEFFRRIPPPTAPETRPFRVMFAGRITRDKGTFDILEVARLLEARIPSQIHWEICGDGPDLEALRIAAEAKGLQSIVTFHGYLNSVEQAKIYATAHVSIVPTRSSFDEGLCKAAIEAVLAGRPVITNRVVPALELIRIAAIEAEPDDPESYANAVEMLMTNSAMYNKTAQATHRVAAQFLDRRFGLAVGLGAVLERLSEQ